MYKTETLCENKSLNITEVFTSVQGETSFTGLPTTFIRLALCNLRCRWCDTSYSFSRGKEFTLDALLENVKSDGVRHICITGGEPLLQKNVYPLMTTLCDLGYVVSIETGGGMSTEAIDPRVHTILDIKCPGSDMDHKNTWENLGRLRPHDEVKFVLSHREDYLWAKDICERYDLSTKVHSVLFSPTHDELPAEDLVGWILEDRLPVRLNLQVHKFIWPKTMKGV
ncbi:MAG: 7-carboxy-7-deazaguanine synthase [Chlamydiales bacterium]|jgi:7-carboxy-7-deazaguanine synthase